MFMAKQTNKQDPEDIMQTEISHREKIAAWSQLHAKSKAVKVIEAESRMMVFRGQGGESGGRNEEMLVKGYRNSARQHE